MKPPRTRLTCRAHNRFSPSLVLWQHFIGTDRPFLHRQRFSSTTAESTQDGPDSGLSKSDAKLGQEDNVQSETPKLRIRKQTTRKGEWHPAKAGASAAKNVRKQYDQNVASLTAADKLLAAARASFECETDYEGVVVEPMVSPIPCMESDLPWCLPKEKMTMSGMDRLRTEIARFCEYSRPTYHEALARRHLIEQVRAHVAEILPHHDLEVFGSERTGLALATSDIDLRLLPKERLEDAGPANLPPKPEKRTEGWKSLQQLHWQGLARHKAYMLVNFRHARYPLISLQDRNSGLDVQIVLANDTSPSREIMKRYMAQYPYLRDLYLVVKTLFDVRGLSDVFRGGFGSYTLFMMIVASIKHSPHSCKDAAGGLINFLRFYRNFQTEGWGISIEPPILFDKKEHRVLTDTTRAKLNDKSIKPLPPYMLCLRDPADETNDLGRKGIAIKHVQRTFVKLCYDLDRHIKHNTRPSLLGPLVGSSYMLNKAHREKLRRYGAKLSTQLKASLAATAKMVRDREKDPRADETEEEKVQARLSQAARDAKAQRATEDRNKKLREEADRIAVLEHGDAMASILGMPAVGHETAQESELPQAKETEDVQPGEGVRIKYTAAKDIGVQYSRKKLDSVDDFPIQEAGSEAEKRSMDSALADEAKGSEKVSG
ncbi:hypothetical protein CC86DRAFT_334778 [Ophiobolus disseminans]|uniref:polynucleotide adenylyltransferase n=1 Tax=Ophiobolus disseminans TaxID=1469910 RepID=A0A6A6ZHQ9_9PLEO|nr:hypothetical protein CC86DRAFT_334778 [Ophiobolus disseminans]